MAPRRPRDTLSNCGASCVLSRQCRWRWRWAERYIGQERKTTLLFSPSLLYSLSHLTFTRFAPCPLDHRVVRPSVRPPDRLGLWVLSFACGRTDDMEEWENLTNEGASEESLGTEYDDEEEDDDEVTA